MCGIVGLFLKSDEKSEKLGSMLSGMLGVMSDRGPDSAGFAVYGAPLTGTAKVTLRGPAGTDWGALHEALSARQIAIAGWEIRDTHVVVSVGQDDVAAFREALKHAAPEVDVVGEGNRMELYKEVGRPETISSRFGLPGMAGTHGIGHTRMATESAVTTDGAHPFSTGRDQCLVHNGSLSNHNALRRMLSREGIRIDTENDSEVAAAYLTWRMREGDNLGEALTHALDDLDGFFTFVVGTETGFGVLRDPIACKPAVMAETDDYVAFASEYRALAGLPDIASARIFEPEPAKVYFWERA
ncbi:Glutamine-fructose-6-phosphate aminotransferase [isomerizing] [Hartmannibacter diazotrophicus]|uniref:Glutamine-fructose-6-phosphate aminotransferase [isomerizing] n=1 Tax=Hartmannibacter diazotrophicus TaxID=1482074 RepID=A0A2C9D9F5_9HYPH|nr:glutamine amidotransferase family protein [Hartmannibacter diazotrophicus]SON56942.1 Glutamine-fructose-6-phosphate aminotransferase [isomerizing] [Hartmannibacter diazotrophicus]